MRSTAKFLAFTALLLMWAYVPQSGIAGTHGPESSAAELRTFAYHENGKLAGWVRRDGPRSWWASNRRKLAVYRDRKGGYKIVGALQRTHAYAWPAPRGSRTHYVIRYAGGDPGPWELVRVSSSRWNIMFIGRLEGFTRGEDGVAAGLAFATFDEHLLPK